MCNSFLLGRQVNHISNHQLNLLILSDLNERSFEDRPTDCHTLFTAPSRIPALLTSALFYLSHEIYHHLTYHMFLFVVSLTSLRSSLVSQTVKNPVSAADWGLIPGQERSSGEGNGSPLQNSCLGNSMDREAWFGYSPQGCKKSDTTERLNTSSPLWSVSAMRVGVLSVLFPAISIQHMRVPGTFQVW